MTQRRLNVAPAGEPADADSFDPGGSAGDVLTKGTAPAPGAPIPFSWQPPGGGLLPSVGEIVWVSKGGSDVTGNGTFGKPYLTINHALSTITDAALAKPYVVMLGPGDYPESVAVRNAVWICGIEQNSTTISGALVSLSADFVTAGALGGFANVDLLPVAVTFDWDAAGADGGTVTLANVIVDTNLTLNAHDAAAVGNGFANFMNVLLRGDYIQNGCRVEAFNFTQQFPGGPAFHITNMLNQSAVLECFGGGSDGNLTVEALAAPVATACTVNLRGFAISAGAMSKIIGAGGVNPTCNAQLGDTPINPNIQATGVADAQMRVSHQFTDIAPNPTAIGAGVVTTIDLPFPAALVNLFNGVNSIDKWTLSAMPVGTNWNVLDTHDCVVYFSYYSPAGVPNVRVHIYNPGAGFNITDTIDLNVWGYLPDVL